MRRKRVFRIHIWKTIGAGRNANITMESFVEAQQYVFDGLWTAAVPFKDKLMEIEEPHKRQFTERIAEAIETQETDQEDHKFRDRRNTSLIFNNQFVHACRT